MHFPMYISLSTGVASASYCSYYSSVYDKTDSKYCSNGCCNTYTLNPTNPCCYRRYSASYPGISFEAVAGIAVCLFVALIAVVTIVVCLCFKCARSRSSTQGHVITSAQPTVSYDATSNQTGMQGYSQPYGVHNNSGFVPPPAYNHTAMPGQHPS
ncbi:uncharacterized protein LOC134727079 [Mytilus trossulus]|uniref:uncharacterized protein LOC134727079 n=1 Tax=Mytilus trossulus TaxID=6551 RepID=UPI00300504E1